jgi:hypothetical protein
MNETLILTLVSVSIGLQSWILLSIIQLKVDVARIKQILNLN